MSADYDTDVAAAPANIGDGGLTGQVHRVDEAVTGSDADGDTDMGEASGDSDPRSDPLPSDPTALLSTLLRDFTVDEVASYSSSLQTAEGGEPTGEAACPPAAPAVPSAGVPPSLPPSQTPGLPPNSPLAGTPARDTSERDTAPPASAVPDAVASGKHNPGTPPTPGLRVVDSPMSDSLVSPADSPMAAYNDDDDEVSDSDVSRASTPARVPRRAAPAEEAPGLVANTAHIDSLVPVVATVRVGVDFDSTVMSDVPNRAVFADLPSEFDGSFADIKRAYSEKVRLTGCGGGGLCARGVSCMFKR